MNESEVVTFTVPGAPVAKGRPRITARGGFARAYTPAKTRAYEDLIRVEAFAAMEGKDPYDGPVALCVTAYVAMPKRLTKAQREAAFDGVFVPTTRPDADNFAKAALDGCNAILFRDDAQVTELTVRKRYGAEPRLVVTMETL